MAKVNVIVPNNLGKTIERGALDANKWDVKFDTDHFEFVEGKGLHFKDSVLQPLKDADIASGSLVGSNLELVKNDGSKVIIPVGNLVPAAKADKFLKSVEYEADTKELVFKVGNDQDATETEFRVNVSDLLPVVTGNGLEGNGTTATPLTIKTGKGLKVTGSGVEFDTDTLDELVDGTGEVSLGFIIPKA